MQSLLKNKWLLIGIAAMALLFYIYFTYFSGEPDPVLTSTADAESSAVTQELLTTLANLKTIRLDDSIFKDPVFISLSDFGVVIPSQPIGRRNPFVPFAGAAGTTTVSLPGAPR
jgi:hypothetical protein